MTTPTDILRNAVNTVTNEMHTSMPGIIKSFNPSNNLATIQPALNRNYITGPLSLPVLENVPIIFPQTNTFSMTYPINAEDPCVLFFSERSIDEYLSTGEQGTPRDRRKFSLSDAYAIPGFLSLNKTFPNNDNSSFTINIGNARFKIGADGTFCFHGISEELMDLLTQVVTAIASITVSADQAGIPNPIVPINNSQSFISLLTRLNTLKGNC